MAKYRKKPLVVDAVQWHKRDSTEIDGVYWDTIAKAYYVITIHGQRAYLDDGDWLIKEPMLGRLYPCKPDIFERTYEKVE